MKTSQAITLKSILNLFNNLHSGITAGNIVTFIEIASHEGITINSIAYNLGVSKKTVSKQVAVLKGARFAPVSDNSLKGERQKYTTKISGTPLVKEKTNTNDKRFKELYLTDKGKELVSTIEIMLQQQNKLDSIDISSLLGERHSDHKDSKERVES